MWLEQRKIDALEQGLKSGQKTSVESILEELKGAKNTNVLTFCPKCGKPFVRRPLIHFQILVDACPEGHGVWLKNKSAFKIRQFFEQGAVRPSILKYARAFFICMAVFTIAQLISRWSSEHKSFYPNYKTTYSMEHLQKVGPQYWPTRDYSQWNAFPEYQEAITDSQELAYFKEWILILNEGIINRLNMNDALLANRPGREYMDVYYFYANKQNEIIRRLYDLYPPDRLQVFHNQVIDASVSQVAFYQDYARRKEINPSLKFKELLDHPKLRDCDQKLWAAFHEFERQYPRRDAATNNAIEQRLCWMDLI